jgi:hypothetical protein
LGVKEDGARSWQDLGPHNIENPAIVLGPHILEEGDDENGALVSIQQEVEGTYVANFQCRIQVSRETAEFPRDVMQIMLAKESSRMDITASLGVARALPPGQKWCIS